MGSGQSGAGTCQESARVRESQDFQAAVTEAVVDNQDAHDTMADNFFE